MIPQKRDQTFVMFVLTFAVGHMALPFIEVDCGLLTVLAKAVDNPSRHFDGPHSIIRTVANKQRALISFDLNRGEGSRSSD
jgi:hypothetical protein